MASTATNPQHGCTLCSTCIYGVGCGTRWITIMGTMGCCFAAAWCDVMHGWHMLLHQPERLMNCMQRSHLSVTQSDGPMEHAKAGAASLMMMHCIVYYTIRIPQSVIVPCCSVTLTVPCTAALMLQAYATWHLRSRLLAACHAIQVSGKA